MKHRRVLVSLATVAALALALGPASADPRKGQRITLSCTGIGVATVVVAPGRGPWAPGLVTTGTTVLVPYEFHITGTFTDASGTSAWSEHRVKRAPRGMTKTTCTWHEEGSEDGGTFAVNGLARGSISHR